VVTGEPVRVGRQHLEVPIPDLRTVKVRRQRWDTYTVGYAGSHFPLPPPPEPPFHRGGIGEGRAEGRTGHPGVEVGDRPDGNLDLVAKGDTESAAVVVPADAAGPSHAEVVSRTNP